MKLDYMVYGRGLTQQEGYDLQSAPTYITPKVLDYLAWFIDLGNTNNCAEIPQSILSRDANPWARTYMFVCQPSIKFCALLRCTRAEGDTPGTWLKEVRQSDVWSSEGWCCPYEKRAQFFALIPSILLWMEMDNTTLYNRNRFGKISQGIELPERCIYNPYSELPPPETLSSLLPDDDSANAWITLCQHISLASQPFSFLFGPLTEYFQGKIGEAYGIQHLFPTIGSQQPELPPTADLFQTIEYIQPNQISAETHTYTLRFRCRERSRKETERSWEIYERPKNLPEAKTILVSQWQPFETEEGLLCGKLFSEAELIRKFAEQMQWIVQPKSAKPHLRYQFVKED